MAFRHGLLSVVVALLVGCTEPPAPAEQQFIDNVAAAMGGRTALESVNTFSMEASGSMLNLGQDLLPETATMEFEISDYRMTADLDSGASRTEFTRTPLFDYFRGRDPMRLASGIDGAVAYDIFPDGSARRAHDLVAAERRATFWHHPLPLVRAALTGSASVGNVRDEGGLTLADITTADGKELTLAVDPESHLPEFIRSTDHHAYLRDVVRTTRFSGYASAGELTLPTAISQSLDEFNLFRIDVAMQTPNADIGDISAPAEAASAPPISGTPPASVEATQVTEGVWHLTGQSHHSVLLEFSDHLMLIEVPNETRTLAVLDKAAELVPGKPVTKAVNSHHHFDHSGGIRTAISRGLTIVTQAGNEAFYRRMAEQPSTIVPDALAANPQPIDIEVVEEHRTYEDEAMTLELFHVADNPHSSSILMGYLPEHRLLIQVDLFTAGRTTPQLFAPNLLDNIERYGLDVETILPLHGEAFGIDVLEAAVAALRN